MCEHILCANNIVTKKCNIRRSGGNVSRTRYGSDLTRLIIRLR